MVIFGKNQDSKAGRKHGYQYDMSLMADDVFVDVLLTERNAIPVKTKFWESETNKEDEVIYELVEEDKNTVPDETLEPTDFTEPANLNEQVEKLCREYESINRQLEKSLIASDDLSKQLEKSKKGMAAGYIAMLIAGLAFLASAGAIVVVINMQRDLTDLKNSVAALVSQTAIVKTDTAMKIKEIDGQIAQLNDKIDKVFAVDNVNNVLQVTKELKKQVHDLASKKVALIDGGSQPADGAAKPDKISLPSLEVGTKELPNVKNLPDDNSSATQAMAKVNQVKETRNHKQLLVNNSKRKKSIKHLLANKVSKIKQLTKKHPEHAEKH